MSRKIYRQEALARLSSPEQLDMLMPVTDGRGWIAMLGLGLVLFTGLAWGIVGSVDTTVEGRGLLIRPGGFDWVVAPRDGKVLKLLVNEGDTVKPGEVLAHFIPDG